MSHVSFAVIRRAAVQTHDAKRETMSLFRLRRRGGRGGGRKGGRCLASLISFPSPLWALLSRERVRVWPLRVCFCPAGGALCLCADRPMKVLSLQVCGKQWQFFFLFFLFFFLWQDERHYSPVSLWASQTGDLGAAADHGGEAVGPQIIFLLFATFPRLWSLWSLRALLFLCLKVTQTAGIWRRWGVNCKYPGGFRYYVETPLFHFSFFLLPAPTNIDKVSMNHKLLWTHTFICLCCTQ